MEICAFSGLTSIWSRHLESHQIHSERSTKMEATRTETSELFNKAQSSKWFKMDKHVLFLRLSPCYIICTFIVQIEQLLYIVFCWLFCLQKSTVHYRCSTVHLLYSSSTRIRTASCTDKLRASSHQYSLLNGIFLFM